MSISLQNLRAVSSGVEPTSLLPGQLCFNLADKVVFVGDGSDSQKSFDGAVATGTPGLGWYSMPMDYSSLSAFFIQNPEYYGDVPQNDQVLSWSQSVNHPIWLDPQDLGAPTVYEFTNSEVAGAPGSNVSEKLTFLVQNPEKSDVAIVSGSNSDAYQGLYFFTVPSWVRAAFYAYPSAAQVTFDNTSTGLPATEAQQAIDQVFAIANVAIAGTTFGAKGQILVGTGPSTYLPLSVGPDDYILKANSATPSGLEWALNTPDGVASVTGTFPVQVDNTDPANPIIGVASASVSAAGVVQLNDSVTSTSLTEAATANVVKTTYDVASAALPKAGGTMTGNIAFANGQPIDAGSY